MGFNFERDEDYITDASDAVVNSLPITAHLILFTTLLIILSFVVWAKFAVLDEVTRGEARVIPSSNLQVIQNLEGGILSKIYSKEGQIVEKDEVLLEIDDTRFASNLRENQVNIHTLQVKMLRLGAEAQGKSFTVPVTLENLDKQRVSAERNLFNSRNEELKTRIDIYNKQKNQKKQELAELTSRYSQLTKNLQYAKKELAMNKPLLEDGIVSQVEIMRLERSVSDLESEIDSNKIMGPRLNSAVSELNTKINELQLSFKTDALNEFNNTRNELKRLQEDTIALEDRVSRTLVRSPVKGTVNQIKHKTLGGIVQGGQDLIEIVPLDDNLLIESKIKPQDIGFLAPGMKAKVKISAYDYSIYGGLDGKVESISADSIVLQNGESYYKVIIRTDGNKLIYKGKELTIIPGMSASVDILTGNKTVLDYILKPLLKTKHNALTER